jgi:hypothetical protein
LHALLAGTAITQTTEAAITVFAWRLTWQKADE